MKIVEKCEKDIIQKLMQDLNKAREEAHKFKLLSWLLAIGICAMMSFLALDLE